VAALLDELCALGRPPDRRPPARADHTPPAVAGGDPRTPVTASLR
jgi:hypothetical protein